MSKVKLIECDIKFFFLTLPTCQQIREVRKVMIEHSGRILPKEGAIKLSMKKRKVTSVSKLINR